MTDDALRIAIAQYCGWTIDLENGRHKRPGEEVILYACRHGLLWHLPNYTSNLNAMHEVENTLGPKDYESYRWILWDMVKRPLVSEWQRAYFSSTARQRAEAFARTVGIWKEGE